MKIIGVDLGKKGEDKSVTATKCEHGVILYGAKCLNCERDKRENKLWSEALERVNKAADKLDW